MRTRNIIAALLTLLASQPSVAEGTIRVDIGKTTHINGIEIIGLADSEQEGSTKKRTLEYNNLENFNQIHLNVSGNLEYTQSENGKSGVTIIASESIADRIVVSTKDGILSINYKKDQQNGLIIGNSQIKIINHNPNNSQIRIIAHSPAIEGVEINSSGDVTLNDEIRCDKLTCKINGSGDIEARHLLCNSVAIHVNGSGDVDLAGKAKHAELNVNGSGEIDSEQLLCKTVKATVKGSGDINCYAAEELNTYVWGSGDITYSGNPRVTNDHVRRKN